MKLNHVRSSDFTPNPLAIKRLLPPANPEYENTLCTILAPVARCNFHGGIVHLVFASCRQFEFSRRSLPLAGRCDRPEGVGLGASAKRAQHERTASAAGV